MKNQNRREDPVETMAAIVIVMLGLLILGGAFLTYQRASSGNPERPFYPVTQERGGNDGTLHVQLTFERDGQIFHSDGYLDHVHIVESIRSDGILYSYALNREIPEEAAEGTRETPEEAGPRSGNESGSEAGADSEARDDAPDTGSESNAGE